MLTKMIWDNEFLLGVSEVDEQHKKLVSLIGNFYDVLMGDEANYIRDREDILKELVAYTVYHFETEEKLFEQYNYEAKEFHKSQHRTFTSEVTKQVSNLLVADVSHGKVFYGFLVTWLLSHIARADRAFCVDIQHKQYDAEIKSE